MTAKIFNEDVAKIFNKVAEETGTDQNTLYTEYASALFTHMLQDTEFYLEDIIEFRAMKGTLEDSIEEELI